MPPLILSFFLLFLAAAAPAQAVTYAIKGDIVGEDTHYRALQGETLYDIARKFDLGVTELKKANPDIDPEDMKAGRRFIVPATHILPVEPREGIVVSLADRRLYYFPDPETVIIFPVGIGKQGWATPTGTTKIVRKRKDPIWTPPPSIRLETPDLPEIVPPWPENPLGAYALDLGLTGIIIHGTNRPRSIGGRVSYGCIRLYPEDIEALFEQVPVGTKVVIVEDSAAKATKLSLITN